MKTITQTTKPNMSARLRRDAAKIIDFVGTTDSMRHHESGRGRRREPRCAIRVEHSAARELSTLFQQEVTFSETPFPSVEPQPVSSNALHNRILIVDDDALVRASLAAVLESEGFVVDEAQNGIEAVTRAIEHAPDLVLLDLNMPHSDGWTAFSQLDRVTPLLPVIVITARPNQYPKAVELGVDAFMEKPLNIPLLLRAIKDITSEDATRHMRRITDPTFVTRLLGNSGA